MCPNVFSSLLRRIRSRVFSAVMLAPPCTTFSRARHPALRTSAEPWGVSACLDSPQLQLANRLTRRTLTLIRLLIRPHISFGVENPLASIFWCLPEVRHHMSQSYSTVLNTDFCQWGTSWKKPTRVWFGFFDPSLVKPGCIRCHPRGCVCSRTDRHHTVLSGRTNEGILWTKVAEPYPSRFAAFLAKIFIDMCHYNRSRSTIPLGLG